MKKRRAETLVEFLVATAIFGTMMIGVCNFIANQTQTLVNIRHRDDFMYYANWLNQLNIPLGGNITSGQESTYSNSTYYTKDYVEKLQKTVSFDWDKDTKILTVKKGNLSLSFNIAPSD